MLAAGWRPRNLRRSGQREIYFHEIESQSRSPVPVLLPRERDRLRYSGTVLWRADDWKLGKERSVDQPQTGKFVF